MLGKRKPNSVIGLIITKVNIEHSEMVIGKFLRNYFRLTIVLMAIAAQKIGILLFFLIFEQWRSHAQLKERKTFWQHRLKTLHPIGLNEKEEYLH